MSNCVFCNRPCSVDDSEVFVAKQLIHMVCSELVRSVRAMRMEELPEDVYDELIDEEYLGRTHGRRATYAKGCHGPLCRKAERDRGWERLLESTGRTAPGGAPASTARARDELLNRCMAWHWFQRREAGANLRVG